MLLNEIFNEKYEFEEVSIKEEGDIFQIINDGKVVINNLVTYAEAILLAGKIGRTVIDVDFERYHQEELDFMKKVKDRKN